MWGVETLSQDEILSQVEMVDETLCWRWQSCTVGKQPYGKMWVGKRNRLVHRVAYEVFRDCKEIDDKQIHHLCGNKWCVNPWHMEAVTQSEHTKAHKALGTWGRPRKARVQVKQPKTNPGVIVRLRLGGPKTSPENESFPQRRVTRNTRRSARAKERRQHDPERARERDRLKYARRMARDHHEFLAKRRIIQNRYYRKRHGVHVELVF